MWTDIPPLNSQAAERLGYPTQKPEALLERIIKASSSAGDTVLDPFCGCGTAIAVAQRLNRNWIGIDVTHLAVTLIKHRLATAFGGAAKFKVVGEPTKLPDAETLAETDPYQFQWWALGLVGARPADQKKGADKGIDGRIYFHDEHEGGKTKQIILSVKAGKTSAPHVRDLRGVVDREKAAIGVLLTLQEPTKPMRTEAASAGFYDSPWGTRHPHLQILTVGEVLAGKQIDAPASRDVRTFKKARMDNLNRILDRIREKPGIKARDIAADLGLGYSRVNKILREQNEEHAYRNACYCWYMNDWQPASVPVILKPAKPQQRYVGVLLAVALLVGGFFWITSRSTATPAGGYGSSSAYSRLPAPTHGGVAVRGYFRSNGTYVQPHYRSGANGIASDNWSARGNVNPYTGKFGTQRSR